jgi:hypothetical protein
MSENIFVFESMQVLAGVALSATHMGYGTLR